MIPAKDAMRKRMLEARQSLSPPERRAMSDTAAAILTACEGYRRAGCVSGFVSVRDEIHTHGILEAALRAGKRVGVPVVRKRKDMLMAEIRALADLEPAPFGLLEPPEAGQVEIPPEAFDLIVVPGLAFDPQGNRIGYGAGFYDRFLARTKATRVGLAFDFQVVPHVEVTGRDVPVDFIATDRRLYACAAAEAGRSSPPG